MSNDSDTSKLWGGRFSEATDSFVQRFTASVEFDQRMAAQDIQGSLAHARMLCAAKVLSDAELAEIEKGLAQVATEIDAYASKPGKKERAARLLRAAMLPKTEKSITQGGKRMSPGQVRYSIAPRAGRKDKPGRVRKDKRKGKNGMIYQKGKAPVPMSEEDWLPAAKKAKKSVKKKSA